MKVDITESLTPGMELLNATAMEKTPAVWKLLELKKLYGGKNRESFQNREKKSFLQITDHEHVMAA